MENFDFQENNKRILAKRLKHAIGKLCTRTRIAIAEWDFDYKLQFAIMFAPGFEDCLEEQKEIGEIFRLVKALKIDLGELAVFNSLQYTKTNSVKQH